MSKVTLYFPQDLHVVTFPQGMDLLSKQCCVKLLEQNSSCSFTDSKEEPQQTQGLVHWGQMFIEQI